MGLTTTRELRWDASGAPVLNGTTGSFRNLIRDFLEDCGWSVVWEGAGAQKVVLRNSLAHGGSGCYVRVLDDGSFSGGARVARVDVYEAMTDIDTGTETAGGGYIWKARTADSAPRAFVFLADQRTIYMTAYVGGDAPPVLIENSAGNNMWCGFAGDYVPTIPGDPGVGFSAPDTQNPGTAASNEVGSALVSRLASGAAPGAGRNFYLARNAALAASPVAAGLMSPLGPFDSVGHGSSASLPRRAEMHYFPAIVAAEGYIRGRMRGLYVPVNDHVSAAGSGVGSVQVPANTSIAMSLATLAGTTASVNSALYSGRLFVERVLSWDDV